MVRGEEGGECYISQTCDKQRFEVEKVSFSWKCLNIFATGCSTSRKSFPVPFNQEGEVTFFFLHPSPYSWNLLFLFTQYARKSSVLAPLGLKETETNETQAKNPCVIEL